MSKRFMFPQQNGDRKKARLDISISDHNFPLSQNAGSSKEPNHVDTWGDDNDDEILLLASQACEEAYNNDISLLPNYSMCMQPGTTSTQFDPSPSTSKTPCAFKKPTTNAANIISTNLKDKCSRISSPLPGITSKLTPKPQVKLDDELIFNDKVYKGDQDYIYKQLLQLQEENNKLKSENGKLLEKCVTKEGEASILRTQLKSCQSAIDNARLERVRAQERVQLEWNEKLTAANGQVHDLRTQLDFKNLEIISIKEKCKMLESNKVRLTQVTVSNHDTSFSNRSATEPPQSRRVPTSSSGVQTDDKARFLRLAKPTRSAPPKLPAILQNLLSPTSHQPSLLESCTEKQHSSTTRGRYGVVNPSTTRPPSGGTTRTTVDESDICRPLVDSMEGDTDKFSHVLSKIEALLRDVQSELEQIAHKATSAFHKEMDEKYIDVTNTYQPVADTELIDGKPLYKDEQAIAARRMLSALSHVLPLAQGHVARLRERAPTLVDVLARICALLDTTSCAIYYSGLLLSAIHCLPYLRHYTTANAIYVDITRNLISCRPTLHTAFAILEMVRSDDGVLERLCPKVSGNLRADYDQGVLLYRKDSCYIQILLKQIEASLKCIERQCLREMALSVARSLVATHAARGQGSTLNRDQNKCDCQLVLTQVLVYSLRICAAILRRNVNDDGLLSVCRSGIQIVYRCTLRDVEFSSQLGFDEGHLFEFCELMRAIEQKEVYRNMLSEICSTFQSSPEDVTTLKTYSPCIASFETFSICE